MERKDFIDYAKAICIVFIVFVHVGFDVLNNFILFVMPMFFAVTGYTYTIGKRTFKDGVFTRFRLILVPFWIAMLVCTVLDVIRGYLFGYGDYTIAFPSLANAIYGSGVLPFEGGVFTVLKDIMSYKPQSSFGVDVILPVNCHLWFLPATFSAYVMFTGLVNATLKNHFYKLVSLVLLLTLSSVELLIPQLYLLPYGIGRGALGAAFMLFGFWIKHYKLLENKNKYFTVVTCLVSGFAFVGALLLGSGGGGFVKSIYGPFGVVSIIITYIGGISGIWLLLLLCLAIYKSTANRIKSALSFVGQNVITVYLWHMAVKLVLDIIYVYLFKQGNLSIFDETKMGFLPENSGVFMAFECVMIILVCLVICYVKKLRTNEGLSLWRK